MPRTTPADDMTTGTEGRNPRTTAIDQVDTLAAVGLLHAEDATVTEAVAAALPGLVEAVDATVSRLARGGSLHYFGAGSSGLLALLDASELPGTFGWDPARIRAHVAGGLGRIGDPDQSVEDDTEQGARDAGPLTAADVAVGVTASGSTPYVRAALETAAAAGALRVLITCNAGAALQPLADVCVIAETGAEAVAGSTRSKAGTAQKLLLNSFSTVTMVRLGATWSNLMVDVVASNAKLRERAVRILVEATGEPRQVCEATLAACDGETKTALVARLASADPAAARGSLADHSGSARDAIAALRRAHEAAGGSA